MKRFETKFLIALLLPFALIMGGGIWGSSAQHTHRSASQGGLIPWIPTGFVGCYAGTAPPTNTVEAYGQAVSRVTYETLFGQISTTYGAGDGVTTFNLPDLRGRVMVGMDNMGGSSANRITAAAADTLGGTGGTEFMSIAQMPAHAHPSTQYTFTSIGPVSTYSPYNKVTDNTNTTNPIIHTVESEGGGQAFNPPFLALKCVIGT